MAVALATLAALLLSLSATPPYLRRGWKIEPEATDVTTQIRGAHPCHCEDVCVFTDVFLFKLCYKGKEKEVRKVFQHVELL